MTKRWNYLIAYDSPSDTRRARMFKKVQGFGLDPQLSFHECSLTIGERRELWQALSKTACTAADRLILVRLDPRSVHWRFGRGKSVFPTPPPLTYVG